MNSNVITNRIRPILNSLLPGLVERGEAVRLALLAAITGEHLLFIGPPGTAKTLVARRLPAALVDTVTCEWPLARFSTPDELFGALSMPERSDLLTEAFRIKPCVAVLDEVFKESQSIRCALLALLNEREFFVGPRRHSFPLIAAVGACVDVPSGAELDPLYDRFLLRLQLDPVSKNGLASLLALRGEAQVEVAPELRLSEDELRSVRLAASTVAVQKDVMTLLSDLHDWCVAEKIKVSDRRWRAVVRLLQTSAFTNGRSSVSISDCWLLQHCIWVRPEQRAGVVGWYRKRVEATATDRSLQNEAAAWEKQLETDQNSRSQAKDATGNLLYRGADGKPKTSKSEAVRLKRGNDLLFLCPPFVQNQQGQRCETPDRSNGGHGYTERELNQLIVYERQQYYGTQFCRWSERASYLADSANWLTKDVNLDPILEPTKHDSQVVAKHLEEVGKLRKRVVEFDARLADLLADLRSHLWVGEESERPTITTLETARRELASVLSRVDKLIQGFEKLPRR